MHSTTGTTPATVADMIDGRGKGEGASKSAQHRTQSSGILDAYSIDPELLWQKKWNKGDILDMKSSSINTKDHNKTTTTTGLRDTGQKSETCAPDIQCPSGIIHHRSPSSLFCCFIHAFSESVFLFVFIYFCLSFFRSFLFLSFFHPFISLHWTSCHFTH